MRLYNSPWKPEEQQRLRRYGPTAPPNYSQPDLPDQDAPPRPIADAGHRLGGMDIFPPVPAGYSDPGLLPTAPVGPLYSDPGLLPKPDPQPRPGPLYSDASLLPKPSPGFPPLYSDPGLEPKPDPVGYSPYMPPGADSPSPYSQIDLREATAAAQTVGRTTLPVVEERPAGRTTLAEEQPAPRTALAEAPTGLKPFALGEHYKGEDTKMGWRADLNAERNARMASADPAVSGQATAERDTEAARTDVRLTKYLTPEQREGYQTTADNDGLLRGADGRKLNTQGVGQGFGGTADSHLFALGTEGKLHTADGYQNDMARTNFFSQERAKGRPNAEIAPEARQRGIVDRTFHHSSFYAGGDVAGAGEIVAEQGRLKELTDGSGHYKPPGEATFQTVEHLAKPQREGGLGVSMMDEQNREAKVTLLNKGPWADRVSLPASSYLQTGGNEAQIRAKKGLMGEIGDRKTEAGNAFTPSAIKEQVEGERFDVGAPAKPAWMQSLGERLAQKLPETPPARGLKALAEAGDGKTNYADFGQELAAQEAGEVGVPSNYSPVDF